MTIVSGTRLGPYEITAKLGEGGMGEVYRARDTKLERDVAIKVLPAAFVEDHERLTRFEREAKLLAQLHHPNIASIFGLEESEGTKALVMELVEGPTLANRLESGFLPVNETLLLARQIAEALEEAHEKGIIHRDLKPQNIKASIEGKVKVLDFGLAKAMDPTGAASGAQSASQLAASPTLTLGATQMGVVLGTAAYMSPEQAKGFVVDKRCDIWSFGVVLFEMLTGKRLFDAPTVPETLAQVLTREPDLEALPASIPAAIRRLLRHCLERNPKNRLHDIADARIVIDDLIAGKTEAPAREVVARTKSSSRRARVAVLGAIAVVAIASFLAGRGGVAPTKSAATSAFRDVRKLTFRPGQERNPALSPDGKSLFFAAHRDGGSDEDIFFVPVGGRRPIDLTADSTADDWSPAVSPDGANVAFRSERAGGGIYLMGTTGESPRRLVDDCFDPAWSPDGARIVCTTSPANDPFDRFRFGKLKIVDVATGASSELATGDAAAPAWSPDGRWIAYWGTSSDGSGQRDLWNVAAVPGGEPNPLTDDAPYDWNPVWSADGSQLYFLSNRGGGPNLWRLPIDRESGRASGAPESVVLPTEFAESAARGGGRWVFSSRSMRATVEAIRIDPDRMAPLGEKRRVFATTTRLQSLVLSPDAATIAYTTVFPRQDLFVARLDGSAPVQLTDDPANDRHAAWDPDGSRILFMSNRSGHYEQWAIRPDGSGLEQLTRSTGAPQWGPRLSPDRRHLAVGSWSGAQIYDAGGPPPWDSAERVPSPEQAKGMVFVSEAWSTDGERLAGFLTDLEGNRPNRISVWDTRAKKMRLFEQIGTVAAWFPDGRHLLVRNQEVFAKLDLANGQTSELPAAPHLAGPISFAPDLRQAVGLTNEDESDLWLAEGLE